MHAIKGGWVGQTFALAKCNETGGKKPRIRRSKEERKAMVESFIKKYQKSNNGNFPSLNLTHKEVGGSFYIIREIVREIIQENRVLGPAKLTEGEQSVDTFLEQNPLGSISTAPQTLLPIQSNGSPLVPSHIEDANDGSVLVSDGLSMESERKKFDSEQINNGNLVNVTNEGDKAEILELEVIEPLESDEIGKELAAATSKVLGPAKLTEGEQGTDNFLEQNPLGSFSTVPQTHLPIQSNGSPLVPSHIDANDGLSIESEHKKFDSEQINNGNLVNVTNETDKAEMLELEVIEPLESDEIGKELAATTSKVTQITSDVVVETFPLRPVAGPTDCADGWSTEVRKLNENLEQTENGNVVVSLENGSLKADDMNSSEVSVLEDKKEVRNNVDILPENPDVADRIVLDSSDPLLESSGCSTIKSALHDAHNSTELGVVSHNDALTSEESQAIVQEAINASNGVHPQFHGTYTGRSSGESTTQEAVVVESKVDAQHANSRKLSNKPLDRINLESWEGTSKRAAQSETNPLWVIFKSFIAAFVKFWSE
ncbi:hypothetical protein COLO4_32868 [Corchorus olitorius]|uniref:AT3G52170-like helix-turn-helix domain-containing protein n=1 Tax=Corchorus olitorius TaxID=93759 RepID=A0A1R3GXM4_9ROSI|nr:hypothetical protein COLO4_32868 [Corchorus olitorius]